MYDKKQNDNSNNEEVTRIGWKGISIVVVVIVILVVVIGFIDSKTPADSQWLNTINAIRTEPVIEIPQTPPEPEITLDSFDDFGITFDEFVQEYNSLIIDGKVNPYPVKFLGVSGELNARSDLPAQSYNTTYTLENGNQIWFHYVPEHGNNSYSYTNGYEYVSAFITTRSSELNIFRISVVGSFNKKHSFFETKKAQLEIFNSMANILLKRAEERGLSKSEVYYFKSKISKCEEEMHYYSDPYFGIWLEFSVKDGVNVRVSPY